ncbi:LUD domain-containing protein [Verrucomicrobia bacterium]|nr:LUD domain-containing protein [Verrucomicrobiota bacterium]
MKDLADMTDREKILGRVTEALKASAPLPGHHGHDPSEAAYHGPQRSAFQQWLPDAGENEADYFEVFAQQSVELKTDFQTGKKLSTLITKLKKTAKENGWKKVAAHRTPEIEQVCRELGLPVVWTDKGYDVHKMESCDAGISGCDALVAQTGSVLVTNRSAGGRALSVLPPHHVVIASRNQMVRDLTAAFAVVKEKYAENYPSMISFITGPSRTGDIERILVLGAHGPKKLTVCCWG